MAVFGAPFKQEDHADRAVAAALGMHEKQSHINRQWEEDGLPPFGLGLGLSTGEAAAALLGSEERLEYTLVGDTVNMSQRLQQLAEAGEIVVSQGTVESWKCPRETVALPPQLVKGRETPVIAYKLVDQACRPGDRAPREGS
jgi:adenylate cyclase